MKTLITNWQTTLAGVLGCIAVVSPHLAAAFDTDPNTIADWNIVIGALLAMFGLASARDANKSSEDNQIKGWKR